MGETKGFHFYDFGISRRVPEHQSQYYLSTRIPKDTSTNPKIPYLFRTYHSYRYQNLGNPENEIVGKYGHQKSWRSVLKVLKSRIWDQHLPENMELNFWKSWIWDQHLFKKIKWQLGEMGSISSKTHWRICWIIETLELWNQEPRNQDTKSASNPDIRK